MTFDSTLSGAVAERRSEEELRSRTFSVTILSSDDTEISGDNHGCFLSFQYVIVHPSRGLCLATVRLIFFLILFLVS